MGAPVLCESLAPMIRELESEYRFATLKSPMVWSFENEAKSWADPRLCKRSQAVTKRSKMDRLLIFAGSPCSEADYLTGSCPHGRSRELEVYRRSPLAQRGVVGLNCSQSAELKSLCVAFYLSVTEDALAGVRNEDADRWAEAFYFQSPWI